MALCMRQSRNILSHVVKSSKIGMLGVTNLFTSPYRAPGAHDSRNPDVYSREKATLLVPRRFESIKADRSLDLKFKADNHQVLDFPGGKVAFTPEMRFTAESPDGRIPCYRVLDDSVQRQGRISFYVTTIGEEAINIASAAALKMHDLIVPQYREPGILLWRGFTLQDFANQCFSNKLDDCRGRQMPVHYGSKRHNYFTVASTIASQLPHAVGAAYSMKMDGKDACAVAYFGDGGSSEGDFHAALNFAAVLEAPVIFICRNNGWAISTPTSDQFRSINSVLVCGIRDGVVVRGPSYGVKSIRVDGNDALAMYSTVHAAREMAIREHRPILIEALTYRAGHHSTSDDSTKYRPVDEMELWRLSRDPVTRFRKWISSNGWWSDEAEEDLRSNVRKQLLDAIQVAEKVEKPPVVDLFTDVYDVLPSNLSEQEKWLTETIRRHPHDYPSDVPLIKL
ncbi:hypothetical protein Tsubulata_030057 [Turnera subulata]|uniref:3-methyl-2-oxobutanoate dehydrogenase (2-methylpropanoyl-transferring) n=1 Tax=Turnera subulata TaxID=218843 RepID=A0A9Q0FL52_9ROSI|nr:hypothetical protein Tsubulata_030057 [Turnera subulata]